MPNEITHADIIERLDKLEAKLEPMFDTWQDVAALGRSGHLIGRAVLWIAAVVVAIMAIHTVLTGGFQ